MKAAARCAVAPRRVTQCGVETRDGQHHAGVGAPPQQGLTFAVPGEDAVAVGLDQALRAMWRACAARDVPVMAHSGHSMGSDDAHEDMAGPLGWQDLLTAFEHEKAPVANTGHFGGEDPRYAWTEEIAALMDAPGGSALYADLGYWSDLRCNGARGACGARPRLQQALQRHPVAAQRLMYGSDWLMLSQERRWDRYPAEIAAATQSLVDPDALFGGNAMQCFRRLTAVAQG